MKIKMWCMLGVVAAISVACGSEDDLLQKDEPTSAAYDPGD